MRIEDIRIGQTVLDEKGARHVIRELSSWLDGETAVDEEGNRLEPHTLRPDVSKPYLSTDRFGHTSFCIGTRQGVFQADIDTEEEAGYNALFVSFLPADLHEEDPLELFALRDDPEGDPGRDVRIMVWEDPVREIPTTDTTICHESWTEG